jgi:rubrerythrin
MYSTDTILKIINEGMEKKDRYVTLYFGEDGISVSVYPRRNESTEQIDELYKDALNALQNYPDTKNEKAVGYWRKKLDPLYYDTIVEGDEETHYHHAQHIYICSECEYTTLSPTNACPHCKASLTKIVDETEHDKDVMP